MGRCEVGGGAGRGAPLVRLSGWNFVSPVCVGWVEILRQVHDERREQGGKEGGRWVWALFRNRRRGGIGEDIICDAIIRCYVRIRQPQLQQYATRENMRMHGLVSCIKKSESFIKLSQTCIIPLCAVVLPATTAATHAAKEIEAA